MGIARRVSEQDLIDDHEKVKQPPIGQGPVDRRAAVAGAESLVSDMRMGHIAVAARRIGIPGHNPVRRGRFSDGGPIEADVESSQVDPFQLDLVGRDEQFGMVPVAGHLAEFGFQSD